MECLILTSLDKMLCAREPFLCGNMETRGCNNETSIHVPNASSSNSSCPSFTLNSSNYCQCWCKDPGYCIELLPESREHQLYIKTKNEGDGDHLLEIKNVKDNTLELLLLFQVKSESVDATDDCVRGDKDDEICVY